MIESCRLVIERAVAFLGSSQLPSGEIPVQASGRPDPSVVPTALAAHALSFAPAAAAVRERALDFLAEEMGPGGLWKHWPRAHPNHHQLPPDLDDTACASAALARAGRMVPDNRARLLGNRNGEGLFRTWKLTSAQLRHPLVTFFFFRNTSAKPFDVDAVVNANVLHYLGPSDETRPVVDHLLYVLRENLEGLCDKWYENPFVVWYFFSRALRDLAPEAGEMIVERVAAAIPRNALEMALAACALLDWNHKPDLTPLRAAQQESGSWPSGALYHGGRRRLGRFAFAAPHPDTPWWGSDALTTVFCIEAISRS